MTDMRRIADIIVDAHRKNLGPQAAAEAIVALLPSTSEDLMLAAALGHQCVANGLAWYDDGQMVFQPPAALFREKISDLEAALESARGGSGRLQDQLHEAQAQVTRLTDLNKGLTEKVRNLTVLADEHLGTPCEQVRWQQEREELHSELSRALDHLRSFSQEATTETTAIIHCLSELLSGRSTLTQYRCFHCQEVFTDTVAAQEHFGEYQDCTPICKVGAEHYRDIEKQLAEYRSESDATSKEFYGLGAKHNRALLSEEERGYERGLIDGRNETMRGLLKDVLKAMKEAGVEPPSEQP